MSVTFQCFHCHKELKFSDKVARRDECPHCRNDVHVCKNCEFYDPKAYNECHEPQAEVTREKDRANYCDYFTPRTKGLNPLSQADLLKAAAEALFKK
jgi:hypothetical protein